MSGEIRKYWNDSIIVEWHEDLCEHCVICTEGLPQVFNIEKRPWVNVNAASREEVVAQVSKCPTAALKIAKVA